MSPYSLYRKDLASFAMTRYNPKDAEGFINLFALPVTHSGGSESTVSRRAQRAAVRKIVGRAV